MTKPEAKASSAATPSKKSDEGTPVGAIVLGVGLLVALGVGGFVMVRNRAG